MDNKIADKINEKWMISLVTFITLKLLPITILIITILGNWIILNFGNNMDIH